MIESIRKRPILSTIHKVKAKNKICPLITIARGEFYACGRERCMFWSDAADAHFGCCEIKEALLALSSLLASMEVERK